MGEIKTTFPQTGILEWFKLGDYDNVKQTVCQLKNLGIKELRTGISWADYITPEGIKWYDWLIPKLAKHFNILPCFFVTPPSYGIKPEISSPPRNPEDFADFLNGFLIKHGRFFKYVELWNEPNNWNSYDYTLDESWGTFSSMIIMAADRAKHHGKKTVLGGISPIDPGWIKLMGEKKVLEYIDVIGIHGFPDVFDSHWRSWEESINVIQNALNIYRSKAEIWITQTGYSTWRYDERKQVEKFIKVINSPVKRVYWYSLNDSRSQISSGRYTDERENHFGMIDEDGAPKLLYRLWSSGGIKNVIKNQWMTSYNFSGPEGNREPVLITGGSGFIGTNLASRLLKMGYPVYIYDNLSRSGVENNLKWLKEQNSANLNIIIADIRDKQALEDAVQRVSHVFHLAAQVAVTTSLVNPEYDYSVNISGTLNLLEAIRKSENMPSLIFASTNKVYGNLADVAIKKNTTRYLPENVFINKYGVNEFRRLDFHSPFGSSKGAADQYILDYARSYGLRNVVFRLSSIYGEHQYGNEGHGWVAYFIRKALRNEKIKIYGDGMQVRDVLYVEDLVDAFLLAWRNIDQFRGEVFNLGGGPTNSISLLELLEMIENMLDSPVLTSFDTWRKGDQKYFISDTTKFSNATGWKPVVSVREGVRVLYDWLRSLEYVPSGETLSANLA